MFLEKINNGERNGIEMEEMKRKIDKGVVIILAFWGVLCIRALFTFCWSDESLYVESANQILQGLITPNQIFSFVWALPLVPFLAVWKLLNGMDGVYLYFRFVMLIIILLCSLKAYFFSVKRMDSKRALTIAILLLIYSRANIMGCSYYNMGLFCFVLSIYCGMSILFDKECKISNWLGLFVFATIAFLTNPFIGVIYIMLIIWCIFEIKEWSLKKYLTMMGGLFIIYYLIQKIFPNIKLIAGFTVDSFFTLILTKGLGYLSTIVNSYHGIFFLYLAVFATSIITVVLKREKFGKVLAFGAGIINIASYVMILVSHEYYIMGDAYVWFTFYFISISPLCFVRILEIKKENILLFIVGILFSFIFYMASNTEIQAIGIGMVVATIGCYGILQDCYGNENRKEWPLINVLVALLVISTLFLRIIGVYRDADIWECTTRIDAGPAKGLYTSEEHYEQYINLYNVMTKYVREDDKYVLVSKLAPWAYLCTDAKCVSSWTWRMDMDSPYLREFCEKTNIYPDYILVLNKEYGSFEDHYIYTWGENGDLAPNTNTETGWLYDYISSNNYKCIETSAGILYFDSKIKIE